MAGKLVCDIRFFLHIRFIFGLYYEFQASRPLQWMARCYCCLICASVISSYYYFVYSIPYLSIAYQIQSTEYILYTSYCLLKGNKYLLQYYKKKLLVDTTARTYKPMRVGLAGYICVMFFMRFFGVIKAYINDRAYPTEYYYFNIISFIAWFAILIGRLPLTFVFALLYTRMRFMRQTLENNNFDCKIYGKNHPRWYMQMYETNMDGLEESSKSVKPQVFISVVSSTAYYIFGVLNFLYFIKHVGLNNFHFFDLTWLMTEVILSYTPMILSSMLADLVSIERQKILEIVITRRIACKNERDREEIQLLLEFLKTNPFEYSLWRVVTINLRSVLTFSSFSFTTIIAIMQIECWSA